MQDGYFPIGSMAWFFQWGVVLFLLGGFSLVGWLLTEKQRVKFSKGLGYGLFFLAIFKQFYTVTLGMWSLHSLPLELCNLMAFAAVVALLTRNQWFYELSVFLGFIAPLQAFVSPAILYGTDSIFFLIFYLEHFLTIFTPIYLTFFLQMQPRSFSWFKVPMMFSLVIFPLMGLNYLWGTNFMFLAARPAVDHPFNFGDWPLYIFIWCGALLASSFVISRCLIILSDKSK